MFLVADVEMNESHLLAMFLGQASQLGIVKSILTCIFHSCTFFIRELQNIMTEENSQHSTLRQSPCEPCRRREGSGGWSPSRRSCARAPAWTLWSGDAPPPRWTWTSPVKVESWRFFPLTFANSLCSRSPWTRRWARRRTSSPWSKPRRRPSPSSWLSSRRCRSQHLPLEQPPFTVMMMMMMMMMMITRKPIYTGGKKDDLSEELCDSPRACWWCC